MPDAPRDACTFCRISDGHLDADLVLEQPHAIAFLDHRPLFPGHVLVTPRDHVPTLPDLPTEAIAPFFEIVQRVSAVLPAAMDAQGTFVAINNTVSQSVPHLHVHVVPRTRGDGLRGFFWPRHPYDDNAHQRAVAQRIRQALDHP